MKTTIASGSNRAMEAIVSAFAFPDFYRDQIVEIKNTIVCISSGKYKSTDDENNNISKHSLNQINRGATLAQGTFEDITLEKNIRVSVFISGFEANK